MILPRIVSSTPSPYLPYNRLQDGHLKYCRRSEPWRFARTRDSFKLSSSSSSSSSSSTYSDDEEDTYLTSTSHADLTTISAAFPSLRSRATILSMAAWFRLLRLVDATLETLPCACALDHVINANLIDALRRGCRIGVVKAARPNPLDNFARPTKSRFMCQSDEEVGGEKENAWGCREGKSRRSSGSSSSSTRTPSPPASRCCDARKLAETSRRLRHLTSVFRSHVQALLPECVYRRLAASICNTWAGYVAEANFRESVAAWAGGASIPRSLLGTYLAVRERTIGVAPFFVLLEADVLPAGHVNSPALAALKQSVTDVVVLQNDLCGLEPDICEDNVLNFVILASDELRAVITGKEVRTASNGRLRGEEFGMTVQEAAKKGNEGILRATALHNNAVEMASRHCEHLVAEMDRDNCDEEAVVANEILNFVTTHYRWASQAWDL
ncbi:hypothetical protein B0J12DRAFT_387998 [Macrophomina phaseolina]|uniref:Terpenoid synthase n=1 Tax=Macrophomina phaseolina TaxID=35725 RepID=A0ABQ8FVN5_9PEZI|nr:hypothetical protein B0J12DRAFT_387998 [Macrophomina phaseolina]